jgi:hypothetical protein
VVNKKKIDRPDKIGKTKWSETKRRTERKTDRTTPLDELQSKLLGWQIIATQDETMSSSAIENEIEKL